jgi:hypothetical protein
MRKILFIDVDGVLNTPAITQGARGAQLSAAHMRRLAMVAGATQCEIVISSSWRHYPEYMAELAAGFAQHVIPKWRDVTPELTGGLFRKDEIWSWIKDNVNEPCRVAVIDDDPMAQLEVFERDLSVSFIQTNEDVGLTDHDVKTIMWLFRDESMKGV